MATTTTYTQGIFQINGAITVDTSTTILQELKQLLFRSDRIIISLDHIYAIDIIGVQALTTFYRKAIRDHKIVTIIGKANAEVARAFGKNNYVLRDDVL